MKVLIVDDDADIRDSLAELFEDEGYSVATAADGSAGLLALKSGALPCVIILDLLMIYSCPCSTATRCTE